MAVVNLNLPVFPTFSTDEYSTISTRWRKYKKRFENLCIALSVTDTKQKMALLLNYIGEEVYDIYESLCTTDTKETYEKTIEILDTHFCLKTNVSYEVYVFRNIKQNVDESINEFYVRLKQQALKCDFKANMDIEIKRQLELATNNTKLRRHSFNNPELSLQDFLIYAKNLEDIKSQVEAVDRPKEVVEPLNHMKKRTEDTRKKGERNFNFYKNSQKTQTE